MTIVQLAFGAVYIGLFRRQGEDLQPHLGCRES